ncbi:TonB-dependent receptor [Massilia sp. CCM 9210]|uniref:TonB-dependent receptor plug domain-containing protein n=1 Tax=Massilia scottii TaxID=3057166 RepID=UPI002796DC39|nr:TonB-dependent receptor [Massilia sp. CCM 9210]MDQ1816266.1 TonB-dependent receptor [Massilia sp. CCM 9210]
MFTPTTLRRSVLLALYGSAALAVYAPASFAQSGQQATKEEVIPSVSVVGSRRVSATSATDTAVPVDLIPMTRMAEQGGQFDLAQTLTYISPSFNSTRQSGADGADLVDSAALRGLGSDQTLVLMNGKRRHSTSLVNIFGARNRGNTGTDMNAIPLLAVKNIQVLRDGAAAQYGSDAIAGVINIELKRSLGCETVFGAGQYSAGDGENILASAYCGVAVAGGVVGITGEYLDRDRSNRAEAGSLRTIGDSKVQNQTLYLNGDIPLVDGKLYFTAGTQKRDASSAAFGRGADQIPTRNAQAMYPNGFAPFINADIDDHYGTIGYRAKLGEWNADFSQTYGYNKMHYNISNTLNASIANLDLIKGGKGVSASQFDAGGFAATQLTTNADASRFYPNILSGMNLAFGAEFRKENYEIFAGEAGSYNDADGPGFGGDPGSQGFPGFRPADATDRSRHSVAAYIDVETDITERLKVLSAVRYEKFSDFGNSVTGKLAAAYKISDAVLMRGSASTGFRAPSLQQGYFSSTFTEFVNGNPVDSVFAPNGGNVANAIGIPKLKEEKSVSFTLGGTWTPTPTTSVTADLYRIAIDDRIVFSGRFDADNYAPIVPLLSTLGVGAAQFFVNSIDTKTQGLDLTVSNRSEVAGGKLNTFLAMNISKTEVTGVNAPAAFKGYEDVLLSERERLFLEQGGPRRKATLGFEYLLGKVGTDFKVIHFGKQTLGTWSGAPTPNQVYKAKTSADLSFTYNFSEKTKLTLGGANIFGVKPTEQNPDETDNGFKYESVQFGMNGASYFARLWHKF